MLGKIIFYIIIDLLYLPHLNIYIYIYIYILKSIKTKKH